MEAKTTGSQNIWRPLSMLFSRKLFIVGSATSLLQKYLLTSSSLEASSYPYNKNFFILKGLASVPTMQNSSS